MQKNFLKILVLISALFPLKSFCSEAVVLKYSTNIDADANKCVNKVSLTLQVNDPKGDAYTSFQIPYSRNRDLKELNGAIKDLNGNVVRKLARKDIVTTSLFNNSTFYTDNLVKRFSLKHNKYPYIVDIEFKYEISPYVDVACWYPVWDDEIETLAADLVVNIPNGFDIKMDTVNIGSPEILSSETGKTFRWQTSYPKLKYDDIFAPSQYDLLPKIEIVPSLVNYVKPGDFSTWKTIGEWGLAIDEGLDDLTFQEQAHIDRLTEGVTDPKKIIGLLYHYMQDNTRYVLVDVDLGGLQPYPASYVCENRFGDCKALVNYMKTMLAYKGIRSNKVDVYAGFTPRKIREDFPSQQFNHVILAVPTNRDTIWLECTSNSSPMGYLGTFTQNRPALWIGAGESHMVKIPPLKAEQIATIGSYHISRRANAKADSVRVSFKLQGRSFEKVTSVMKNWSEKDKRDYFNRFLGFKNYQSEDYQVVQPDRDSSFLWFETRGMSNTLFQTVGDFVKVELPPMDVPDFEKVKDRELPVNINIPLGQTDTLFFDLGPGNFELITENEILFETSYGKLVMTGNLSGNTLVIIRKYEIPTQEIPLEQYRDFYAFLGQIKSKGSHVIVKPLTN